MSARTGHHWWCLAATCDIAGLPCVSGCSENHFSAQLAGQWPHRPVMNRTPLRLLAMAGVRALGRGASVVLLGAATVYGHVLYPVYIGLKSRGLTTDVPDDPAEWPSVSVVVAAYRESTIIATKLDALMATAYPGQMEIIVVADDEETASSARRAGVRVLATGERLGKARAVNRGVSAATNDIVLLT